MPTGISDERRAIMSLRATLWTLVLLWVGVLSLMAQTFPAEALPLLAEDSEAVLEAPESQSQSPQGSSATVEATPYFSAHYGRPEDANAFAQDLGCFEDEVLVIVIAEVQPSGKPSGLRWAPKGDLTGRMVCVTVDDYFEDQS